MCAPDENLGPVAQMLTLAPETQEKPPAQQFAPTTTS
jgi:hypothetical protein